MTHDILARLAPLAQERAEVQGPADLEEGPRSLEEAHQQDRAAGAAYPEHRQDPGEGQLPEEGSSARRGPGEGRRQVREEVRRRRRSVDEEGSVVLGVCQSQVAQPSVAAGKVRAVQ